MVRNKYISQSELLKHIAQLRQTLNEIQDIQLREKLKKEIDEVEKNVTNTNNKELIPSEKIISVFQYGVKTGLAIIDDNGKRRLCVVEIIGNNIYLKEKIVLKERVTVEELMKKGRKIYISPEKIPADLRDKLKIFKAQEIDIL